MKLSEIILTIINEFEEVKKSPYKYKDEDTIKWFTEILPEIEKLEKNQEELVEALNKNIQFNCNECIVVIDDDDRRCEKCPINKDKQLLQKITGEEQQ